MTNELIDPSLVFRAKRPIDPVRHLTPEECVAINLFRREGVRVAILAKVFGVCKNTVYYRALTGDAESYLHPAKYATARDTKELIDRIGVETAKQQFVTDEMKRAVTAELKADLERKRRKSV